MEDNQELSEEDLKTIMEYEAKESYDLINPNHYKTSGKEVWKMMVDIWGVDAFITHCEITAFKYRMRMGKKPNQSVDLDLAKSAWYENKAEQLKNEKNENGNS